MFSFSSVGHYKERVVGIHPHFNSYRIEKVLEMFQTKLNSKAKYL